MKKLFKIITVILTVTAILSFAGCSKKENSASKSSGKSLKYADVELGKTGTDISATLKLLTHRTDMLQDSYTGITFAKYLAEFNKKYPNIKVEIEGITDYASVALLRLQGGDWGDIMMIPAIDKKELKNYFGESNLLFKTIIPRNIRLAEAPSFGKPCLIYDPESTGTKAYLKLAREIIQRDENVQLNEARKSIDVQGKSQFKTVKRNLERSMGGK